LNITDINRGKIKGFLLDKINQGYAKSTVSHMKDVVSGVLNNALDDEIIPANPALRLGKLLPRKDSKFAINPLSAKELAHLSQDFENDLLEVVSEFGKDAIRAGKSLVLAELAAAGFKHSQVRFGSESDDSVCYLAAVHTPKGPVEIEVPVEMQITANSKYRPLAPSCFAYDGLIEDFTPAKLQRFALNIPQASSKQVVYSTEHSYMTLPELRDEIIKAASSNDYVECEMILGTIQDRFNEEDYRNAVADYHYLLMLKNQEKVAHYCSKEIPAGKGSIEARCGHFGVPMSKVTTDKDGNCILKSSVEREKLNPVKESGAAISTSKLFWS